MAIGIMAFALPVVAIFEAIENALVRSASIIVSVYSYFTHFARLGRLERAYTQLSDQGLDTRIWAANRKQQMKLGFERVGDYSGFELLARPIGEDTPHYGGHEIVIRNREDTIAVADVIKIHDEAYWHRTWYKNLEIDGEPVQLWSLFEEPDVRSRFVRAQAARSDIISVGLTTNSVEAVSSNTAKTLSLERAKTLGRSLLSHAGLDTRRSNFYGIGLGQSLTKVTDPESDEARNQRSAIILAITRRQEIRQHLDLEQILEALVQNYKTNRIDLSNYEHSDDIARQLQENEIDYAGFV